MALPIIGGVFSEILVVAALAIVIFVIWKSGKFILKLIFGIIANTVLGLIALFVASNFFGLSILSVNYLSVLISIAIFGLPGLGTIILLKLLGVVI